METVVGWTGTAIHTNNARGFIWKNGKTVILPTLPNGISSTAWSVNVGVTVCGTGRLQWPSGGTRSRAFIWSNGNMTDLGVLSGYRHSGSKGISEDGRTVIGACSTLENGIPASSATIWRDKVVSNLNSLLPPASGIFLTDAYAINELGQVLCEASHSTGPAAVVLTPVFAPPGDVTLDCIVNVNDLLAVINAWGQTLSAADLNGDGIVNVNDLLIVLNNWTLN